MYISNLDYVETLFKNYTSSDSGLGVEGAISIAIGSTASARGEDFALAFATTKAITLDLTLGSGTTGFEE